MSLDLPEVKPFVIAIWCGEGKPDDLHEYLSPFVEEINCINRSGFSINGHEIEISSLCFICDAPARAFLKGKDNILLMGSLPKNITI